LLKRVLKGEPFIDEEAPQIRIEPITRGSHHLTGNDKGAKASMMVADMVGSGSNGRTAIGGNMAADGAAYGTVLIALLVGFLVGAFVVKKREQGGRGYHRVPDVAANH